MELLKLPQLKLVQLQGLSGKILTVIDALPELAGNTSKAHAQYAAFKQAMTREKAASDKRTLDNARDQVNSGFFNAVQAEQAFPHDSEAAQSALKEVTQITEKYGFKLNRLPYDEQTTATDNFLAELNKINLEALPALSRWIPKIKMYNDVFKEGAVAYFQDVITVSSSDSATELAPGLIAEIEKLLSLLFAHLQIAGNEALDQAYVEIKALIDQY